MIYVLIILAMVLLYPAVEKRAIDSAKWRKRKALILGIYLLAVLYLTLYRRPFDARMMELEPFRAFRRLFRLNYDWGETLRIVFRDGWEAAKIRFRPDAYKDAFLNMLLFIPYGYLLKRQNRKTLLVILTGFFFSLGIEMVQYYTKLGCFELDDLWHNGIGVLIGTALSRIGRS